MFEKFPIADSDFPWIYLRLNVKFGLLGCTLKFSKFFDVIL